MTVLTSVNPATLKESGSVETTDPADIPRIIGRSRAAQERWARVPPKERAALLKKLRMLMTREADRVAETVHKDTGKPRAECYNTELLTSVVSAAYHEGLVRKFRFREKVDQGPMSLMMGVMRRKSYVEYLPLGVVAVISPFNFPLAIPFTQTAAAVAAGNSVILKPSSETPLTGQLISDLFTEAGFPEDLVIVIHGPGTSRELAASPGIDRIVFTGSTETGRDVMRSAAKNLTPVTLELGGKDAMIVFDDADLERAADCAVWASFVNSGQVCVGVRRIYVQEGSFDRFLALMKDKTSELRQGNGWDDTGVSVGPMINGEAVSKMESVCAGMISEGGTIITGGKRNPDLEGMFFEPTIVVGVPEDAGSVKEEIFGPVVSLFPFSDEEEAVRLADCTDFALAGSVWTSDLEKGRRVASDLRSGTIVVNNAIYTYGLPATPWGGSGESGFGITHSEEGFRQMMRMHHVHVDKGSGKDAWWMPYSEEGTKLQKNIVTSFFGDGKGRIGTIRGFLSSRKS
jgi:acyl-CoA reductase-like NAD-dependent aldehyde dehydrogenase